MSQYCAPDYDLSLLFTPYGAQNESAKVVAAGRSGNKGKDQPPSSSSGGYWPIPSSGYSSSSSSRGGISTDAFFNGYSAGSKLRP